MTLYVNSCGVPFKYVLRYVSPIFVVYMLCSSFVNLVYKEPSVE